MISGSRKKLKQHINGVMGELFSECLFCRLYVPGANSETVDVVLVKILTAQDDFLKRINHYDGKENRKIVKAYFRKLKTDFLNKTNEVINDIQNLNK